MADENTKTNTNPDVVEAVQETAAPSAPLTPSSAPVAPRATPFADAARRSGDYRGPQGGRGGPFKKNTRGPRRDGKPRSEFDQKILDIRRVTRVVSGGRRFSFSVALVAGDKKGRVGVGIGKAGDTSLAIDKALKNAKKNMIRIPLTKNSSIPHEVSAKYTSSRVVITPAKGRGMIAGSSVRNVLELGGVKDVMAKIRSGSKNKLNNARVAVIALSSFQKHRPAGRTFAPKSETPKA